MKTHGSKRFFLGIIFLSSFLAFTRSAPAKATPKTFSNQELQQHLNKFMEELSPDAKAFLAASAAACPAGGKANVIFSTPPNNNVLYVIEQCSTQCQLIAGNTVNGDELCLKIFNVPENATFNGGPIPTDGSDVACAANGIFSGTFCFSPDFTQSGVFSILFVLTDKVTTCSQTRIVTFIVNCETKAPEVTCPPAQTASLNADCQAVVPDFTLGAIATDNCTPNSQLVVTQNPPAGSLVGAGVYPIVITAVDACGNAGSCQTTLTVVDNTPPTIACPADITVGSDAGVCGAVVHYTTTASDNCPGVTFVCAPPSGSFFLVATTPVTCTATDAAGNTASCSFNVTVNDNEAPIVTCPPNISVHTDSGRCDGEEVNFVATGTDNCSGVTTTCNPSSGSFFPVGVTAVTCSASDGSGNNATCQFNVEVFVLRGDMDGNGLLTPPDPVLLLFCAFLGSGTCDLCFADLNCDGFLTPVDPVLELLVVFLGLQITCQP